MVTKSIVRVADIGYSPLLFLDPPESHCDYDGLVVNHKNGIPGDDELSNLEWCTYSHNTQHAYDNNLHPNKTKAILVKDFVSDKITRYPSIASASMAIGWDDSKMRSRLIRQPGARYGDNAVKLDDGKPWPKLFLRENDVFIPVITKNVLTGEKRIYESVAHAARYIGITQSGGMGAVRKKHTKPLNFHLLRFLSSSVTWPVFNDVDLEIIKATPHNPVHGVTLKDITDGGETFFPSKREAMSHLHIDLVKFNNAVGRGSVVNDRFVLSKVYLSTNKRYIAPLPGNGHRKGIELTGTR